MQSQVQNQIDFAVAGKTLQAQKQQGDAVVQLIEHAAQIQINWHQATWMWKSSWSQSGRD